MKEAQMTIPHLLRCPISLDLFEDPVTLCTGQTYDRSSIEKWLAAGNLTCPVTMQKLYDPSIVPNHTLRHLIDQWLQLGPQFDPNNSAATDSLANLKHILESDESTLENKLQALEKINVLSDEYCSFKRSCFIQLGFLPLLLEIVFGRIEIDLPKNINMEFIEVALSCILKLLPLGSLEPLNMVKEESKLAKFLLLFEKGSILIKTNLCYLIDPSSSPETEEFCSILGNSHKLVHEIILLIRQNSETSEAGIKAMSALCSLQSNRENLVKAGAIDAIVIYISNSERRLKVKNLVPLAMAILEKLLALESGKEALVKNPSGIEIIVKMVFRVSDQECGESAVGALLNVCRESESAREEAIVGGVLTQLLLLLQSQCSARTKTKARMLLKLLRSKWAG